MVAVFSRHVLALADSDRLSSEKKESILSVSWVPEVFELVASLAGNPNDSLDDFLLPDDHIEVKEWIAHRMQCKTEQDTRKANSSSDLKFEDEHLEHFSREGFQWPPGQEALESVGLLGRVEHLPRRHREAVYFHTAMAAKKNVPLEDQKKVIDLNPRSKGS